MKFATVALLGAVAVGAGTGEAVAAGVKKAPQKAPATALATIERDAFSIDVGDGKGAAGTEVAMTVTVKAKGGYHVNQEFPHHLTLGELPAGLKIEKKDLKRGDAELSERALAFKVSATPEKKGRYTIPATLKTSVCDDKECMVKKEKLSIVVVAK
jgi:hypothetical protein